MAFTPEGMFYLSKEDLSPTLGGIGKAGRGMLGLQNKEEAIQSILQSADYNTPEGRQSALNQIRGIDVATWEKLNKMNQDYELSKMSKEAYAKQVEIQEMTLQEKKEERERKRKHPRLRRNYRTNNELNDIRSWLTMNSEVEPEDIAAIGSLGQAQDALAKKYKGKSGGKYSELKKHLQKQEDKYVSDREYLDDPFEDAPTETTVAPDEAFDTPRGNVPTTTPTTGAAPVAAPAVVPRAERVPAAPRPFFQWNSPHGDKLITVQDDNIAP